MKEGWERDGHSQKWERQSLTRHQVLGQRGETESCIDWTGQGSKMGRVREHMYTIP